MLALTEPQQRVRDGAAGFVAAEIRPYADQWDGRCETPAAVVDRLGKQGYLGAVVPPEYGGQELDPVSFGLLNEQLGSGCSSVRSLLTVHSMVCAAIARWGGTEQRRRWLPALASGECVGAFALTEPEAGSDPSAISATARPRGDGFVLDGVKRWITYGQLAGVFLVFAKADGQDTALLVPRQTPGLTVHPITGGLGTRASMLAELRFAGCELPADALLGRRGFGLAAVAASALELGRYSVAWGCVGIAQACLDAVLDYTDRRRQFGRRLREHQLVQRRIAEIATNTAAARLLCRQAGELRATMHADAVQATWMAKHFAARTAFRAADDAVQIHGANGCGDAYPVARLLRDAKVMEIIEGSTEIQQLTIAQLAHQAYLRAAVGE